MFVNLSFVHILLRVCQSGIFWDYWMRPNMMPFMYAIYTTRKLHWQTLHV